MAVVSRLELNHPALGTAGGSSLHASIEALYEKIGDALSSRWFSLADFDQAETVDLDHNFLTDKANLQIDLMNFVGGKWVKLTDQTSPSTADFTIIEKVGDEKAVLQITNDTGGNDLTFAVSISFQPIYLSDGDVKDVVLTSAGEGHSLVFDDASKSFVNDSTAALKLPVGTTAQRPTPVDGHVRYNSDLVRYEGYKSGAWGELGGGGAGGKNYILNPDAAVDATTGVTNTATTGSWTIDRTTTAAELPEETKGTAYRISGSTLTVGDTVEFAIEATGIDDADGGFIARGVIKVLDISGAINGEYEGQFYSVTDSVYVGDEVTITGTGTYIMSVPIIAGNDYEFHLKAATASPTNIGLSGITLEPESQTVAGVVSKWESYTPSNTQGFGTITSRLQWRTNGQNIEIRGDFTTGTVSASEAQIELPNSYTISFENSTGTNIVGTFARDVSDSNVSHYAVLATDGDTFFNFGRQSQGSSNNLITAVGGSSVSGTGTRPSFFASVPVAELANNYTPTISDVQYENSKASYNKNDAQTFANNLTTTIIYDDAVGPDTTLGQYDSSTGIFTSAVNQTIAYDAGIYWTTTGCSMAARKNSTIVKRVNFDESYSKISGQIYLEAGDTLDFTGTDFINNNPCGTSTIYNWLELSRVPDFSARSASLPLSDIADDTKQYLLPRIQRQDIDLTGSGSFTAGTLKLSRIGDVVTVTILDANWSGSLSTISSASGLIPADYRPEDNHRDVSGRRGSNIVRLDCTSAGVVTLSFENSSFTLTGSSGPITNRFSTSYIV